MVVHVGLIAHRLLPPFRPLPAAENHRVSRFSRAQRAPSFYACVGSTTPQGRNVLALFAHAAVLPSGWPDTVGAHGFGDFGAHQLQGYPAHICPWPTLQVQPHDWPHMARGQDGSLLLSCMTLAFTTSRRFVPTLSRPRACPASRQAANREALSQRSKERPIDNRPAGWQRWQPAPQEASRSLAVGSGDPLAGVDARPTLRRGARRN